MYCTELSFQVGVVFLIIPTVDTFILLAHESRSHQLTLLFMELQLYSSFSWIFCPSYVLWNYSGPLHWPQTPNTTLHNSTKAKHVLTSCLYQIKTISQTSSWAFPLNSGHRPWIYFFSFLIFSFLLSFFFSLHFSCFLFFSFFLPFFSFFLLSYLSFHFFSFSFFFLFLFLSFFFLIFLSFLTFLFPVLLSFGNL